jgi:archaellum component FlaC
METAHQSNPLDETGTVVFDAASGISLEEQREILAGINAMAAGNKFPDGSKLPDDTAVTKAKKNGALFPLLVNIGALALLASAFILLAFLNGNNEQEIRESRSSLGLSELGLVQQIRQETDRQIREKENQINDILLKLQAVDAEYKDLQMSVDDMTAAQKQRAASLLILQDEYQRALLGLNEEKAGILEDSRQREADLRAKASSPQAGQGLSDLDAAMDELKKLGTEQERVNRVESEMNGFFTLLNSQIESGRLAEARDTIKSMKEFLNAPSLHGLRVFEARKQTYLAAVNALEKATASFDGVMVISDAAQEETIEELKAQNTALERSLAAFTAAGADQNKIIAEYAASLKRLESSNAEQNKVISEYSSDLRRLESNNAVQKDTLSRQESEIQNLRTVVAQREQRVSELNNSIAALQTQYDDLQGRMDAAIKAFYGE